MPSGATDLAEGAPARGQGASRVALPLLGLAATSGPLVLAGFLEGVLGLEDALSLGLVLAGGVVAVAWPFLALAAPAREAGVRGRATELLLLGASLAPALRLAKLLARSPEDATDRAFVGLAVLLLAQAVFVAGVAKTRLSRELVTTLRAALAFGAPLAGVFLQDALGKDLGLARASIPAALLLHLEGGLEPWWLALGLAALGVLAFGKARFLVPVLVALAIPAVAGDLEIVGEPAPLLGPKERAGEPAPLRVSVRAGAKGFEGELGARGGGLLVLAPLSLGPGIEKTIDLPAIGEHAGTPLIEARPRNGEPFALAEPDATVTVLGPQSPLVVAAPDAPRAIRVALDRALAASRGDVTVVPPELLDLASLEGGAIDVLAVGRGTAHDLATFATTGGTLVLPDAATLDALAPEGAGPRGEDQGVLWTPLGAGLLVAPVGSDAVALLVSRLSIGLHRPESAAIANKLADSSAWPEPGPSARTSAFIAAKTALVLAVLVLALLLATETTRTPVFLLASLVATLLLPRLVLGPARAPVYLETVTVLEAPSGGSLACSTETLRFGSPRRAFAEVTLERSAPLTPCFTSEEAAKAAHAELRLDAPSRLRVALGRGTAVSFARRTPHSLGGTVTIAVEGDQVTLTSTLGAKLEHPLLLGGRGALVLDDLGPGETRRVSLADTVPFDGLRTHERATGDRRLFALVEAALPRGPGVRLLGFLPSAPAPPPRGVLEATWPATLLVVRARL
jgi:hypothetical protein